MPSSNPPCSRIASSQIYILKFSDNVFILFYILILQFQGTGLLESITHHYETISHDFNTTLAVADDETKSDFRLRIMAKAQIEVMVLLNYDLVYKSESVVTCT